MLNSRILMPRRRAALDSRFRGNDGRFLLNRLGLAIEELESKKTSWHTLPEMFSLRSDLQLKSNLYFERYIMTRFVDKESYREMKDTKRELLTDRKLQKRHKQQKADDAFASIQEAHTLLATFGLGDGFHDVAKFWGLQVSAAERAEAGLKISFVGIVGKSDKVMTRFLACNPDEPVASAVIASYLAQVKNNLQAINPKIATFKGTTPAVVRAALQDATL